MKAYVETYGCTLNQADSRIIKGFLEKEGVGLVKEPKKADLIFINSCGVKHTTERKILYRINKLRETVDGKIIVCGCLPKINEKAVRKAGADLLLDTNSLDKIPLIVKGEHRNFFSPKHLNKLEMPMVEQGIVAIIPIAEGCLGNCAFCATRNARGVLTSYPLKDIRLLVEQAVQNNAREIMITAEDVGFYGWDINTSLPALLRELVKIRGTFKMRIGMMDPFAAYKMLPELLDAFDNPKIYQFVHLPVQSGSNKVLKAMNRKYSVEQFKKVTEAFRSKFPDITLSTDIITGFPGETEEDFQETLNLLRAVKPEMTNISMFYPRPRTPAARMKKLPTQVVKERSRICSVLCRDVSLKASQRFVGREFEAVILKKGKKGGFVARLPNYKQAILEEARIGEKYKIKVTEAHPNYLKAASV